MHHLRVFLEYRILYKFLTTLITMKISKCLFSCQPKSNVNQKHNFVNLTLLTNLAVTFKKFNLVVFYTRATHEGDACGKKLNKVGLLQCDNHWVELSLVKLG